MVVFALALDVLLVMLAFVGAAAALFHPTRLRWIARAALFAGLALLLSSALTGLVVAEAWRTVTHVELGLDTHSGYLGYAAAVTQAESAVERHALAVLATAVLAGGAALALRGRSRSARTLLPAALSLAFAELLAAPAIVVLRRNASFRPDADAAHSLLSARESAQQILLEGRLHVGLSVLAGGLTVVLALAAARARGHDPWRRARPTLDVAGYALFGVGLLAFALTRGHAHDAAIQVEPDERACPAEVNELELEALVRSDFEPEGLEAGPILHVVDDEGRLGSRVYHHPSDLLAHLDRVDASRWDAEPRRSRGVIVVAQSYARAAAEHEPEPELESESELESEPGHARARLLRRGSSDPRVRWIDGLRADPRVRGLVRLPDRSLETATLGPLPRRPRCAATELGVAFPRVEPERCRLRPIDLERVRWSEDPVDGCQNALPPLRGAAF